MALPGAGIAKLQESSVAEKFWLTLGDRSWVTEGKQIIAKTLNKGYYVIFQYSR